jgi:hypothetical protein
MRDMSSSFSFTSDHPSLKILCSLDILMVLCHHLPKFVGNCVFFVLQVS